MSNSCVVCNEEAHAVCSVCRNGVCAQTDHRAECPGCGIVKCANCIVDDEFENCCPVCEQFHCRDCVHPTAHCTECRRDGANDDLMCLQCAPTSGNKCPKHRHVRPLFFGGILTTVD